MISIIKKLDHKLFLPYLEEEVSNKFYVNRQFMHFKYDELFSSNTPEVLKNHFKRCAVEWELEKFIFHFTNRCIIEPSAGWAITEGNKIIPQSVWNYFIHKVNKPYFLRYKFFPKKQIHLKSAISLQYAWMNYWHFYNDILGQLVIADEVGLPFDTPIIIPSGVQRMNYFKEIINLSKDLKTRNWIFQDKDTHVVCENAYFFNTFWNHRDNFDGVLNYIDFDKKFISEQVNNRKIFIGRGKSRGRNIINMDEVSQLLKKYSFNVIDCDELSFQEQIEVFQNAGYVIGIHGAALTNVVYRTGKPLKVLEISTEDVKNPTYYWLCQQYNFDYYGILGNTNNVGLYGYRNLHVDTMELENKIKLMLS